MLREKISTKKAAIEQNEMIDRLEELKGFIAILKANAKTKRKEDIRTQKSIVRNALNLYDKRTAIINAFVSKSILPGDVEKDVYYWDKEPIFEESIGERTKMRRQNQEGQGLKILTPNKILSRLPVSLAQLKAENNS